jgi:peptidoglycan hydrolase-like protein with peptidoglycan-binding domain
MKAARTIQGLAHGNTLVLRKVKVYFQRFAGKHGTDADRGILDAEYTLKVGGRTVDKGKTAADGSVELLIPAEQPAELTVFGTTYALQIANHLESDTNLAGQQRRFSMLGYELGTPDGTWGRNSDAAALNFQGDSGLGPDGAVGANTRAKLTSTFGE